MLSRCFLDCSVGVGVFVTGLSQICSFFSSNGDFETENKLKNDKVLKKATPYIEIDISESVALFVKFYTLICWLCHNFMWSIS